LSPPGTRPEKIRAIANDMQRLPAAVTALVFSALAWHDHAALRGCGRNFLVVGRLPHAAPALLDLAPPLLRTRSVFKAVARDTRVSPRRLCLTVHADFLGPLSALPFSWRARLEALRLTFAVPFGAPPLDELVHSMPRLSALACFVERWHATPRLVLPMASTAAPVLRDLRVDGFCIDDCARLPATLTALHVGHTVHPHECRLGARSTTTGRHATWQTSGPRRYGDSRDSYAFRSTRKCGRMSVWWRDTPTRSRRCWRVAAVTAKIAAAVSRT
jgi:hypothetical protein